MSIEEYLSLTDEDIRDFIAYDQGYTINHPFIDSCLQDLCQQPEEESEDEEDNGLYSNADILEMITNDSFSEVS